MLGRGHVSHLVGCSWRSRLSVSSPISKSSIWPPSSVRSAGIASDVNSRMPTTS